MFHQCQLKPIKNFCAYSKFKDRRQVPYGINPNFDIVPRLKLSRQILTSSNCKCKCKIQTICIYY
ncbi:hypothetical protein BpHYR1_043573 [Brachionus plicatilis]|uniref:Uncharacterized protein n=1 Tax=Brachionus plicatilis TaxID=10195 RepID=A0A3M7SNW0_BRAPC|nr:hypothetical protein BpHYR1_043573 [Brachionus plicatilis]